MRKKGVKHTPAVEARLALIEKMLVQGIPRPQVERFISEKEHITDREVREDFSILAARWKKDGTSQAKLQLIAAYRQALQKGQIKTAIQAIEAARKGEATEQGKRDVARLRKLGRPPKDGIDAVVWSQRALVEEMHITMQDPSLTRDQRQALMLKFGRGIAALTPYAEIQDAMERIRRDLADLDEPAAGTEVKPRVNRTARSLRSEES